MAGLVRRHCCINLYTLRLILPGPVVCLGLFICGAHLQITSLRVNTGTSAAASRLTWELTPPPASPPPPEVKSCVCMCHCPKCVCRTGQRGKVFFFLFCFKQPVTFAGQPTAASLTYGTAISVDHVLVCICSSNTDFPSGLS